MRKIISIIYLFALLFPMKMLTQEPPPTSPLWGEDYTISKTSASLCPLAPLCFQRECIS